MITDYEIKGTNFCRNQIVHISARFSTFPTVRRSEKLGGAVSRLFVYPIIMETELSTS